MDLLKVMARFPDQEACISHLEKLRWQGSPVCPHCESEHVGRREETKIGRIGRWNCYDCTATFKVTCKTVFHGTKIALRKWFLASLMTNAKKSLPSCQLARDLDLNPKTTETYIDGKPRKPNKREDDKPSKRGRGTEKTAIIGAVQRGGKLSHKSQNN